MSNQAPSGNPTPLEKTLMHMDLSHGVNEQERPETSNPITALTRVENLVQDTAGAYIKRPGNTSLGGIDTGASYTPSKLLRMREGLGMVDDASNFYQYQESTGKFRARGSLPVFSVSSDTVVSSGATVRPGIVSAGSSSKFHFVIYDASGDSTFFLTLFDRQSGSVVAQYNLATIGALVTTTTVTACMVDDRYIHVVAGKVTTVESFVIDTASALPDPGSITVHVAYAGEGDVWDIVPGIGVSYFAVSREVPAGDDRMLSMSNSGTIVTGATLTSSSPGGSVYSIGFSGTNVWYMSDTSIGAVDGTTLAVSVAAGSHGGPSVDFAICADRTNRVRCAYETTTTFGGTTVKSVSFKKTSANGTALGSVDVVLDGWRLGSTPFEALVGSSYDVYVQLHKDTSLSPSPACVVSMNALIKGTPTLIGNSYDSIRVAANVEPFLAVRNSYYGFLRVNASDRITANEFSVCIATQVQARGFGYCMYSLRPGQSLDESVSLGGGDYISGGAHCLYAGGEQPVEVGFVDIPALSAQVGAAGSPSGAYKYLLQFRYTDETGSVTWSRTSPIVAITLTSQKGTITMSVPNVTCKDRRTGSTLNPPLCDVELYRTKAGGTQFYLNASSSFGTPSTGTATQAAALGAARFYTVTDNMSDSVLAAQPTLFRQPGTPNSGLDRYPPPAGNILCQHKDRLFTVDSFGARVCYSSFYVDGESAWFNPAFSFFCHGGSGRITGMVSMDGRLFVFKRDGVFVVDGDGPSEGGVAGNEFSPPQRLATEYGCVDHRSLVVTSDGIMYLSSRGIELLTRGLKVVWAGQRVVATVNANPAVLGSALDAAGRVHFCLASSTGNGPAEQDQIAGVEVVYDSSTDSWTTYYGNPGTGYGKCQKSTVMARLYGKGDVQCYANAAMCTYSDATSGLDGNGTYPPSVMETGWIRTGQQVRQRITDAYLLAKRRGNHAIRISAAYDFVDSYTQTFTWQPDVINAITIEQLCLQMVKPQCLAVRLLVEEIAATDQVTYPSAAGLGCAVLGLTFQVAPLGGAPTVSAVAQGFVAPPQALTDELGEELRTELSAIITTES